MNDAYTKCRNCVNFGTENCPESSLCFALNYKPFYKAKPKLKKKYRRAVRNTITGVICLFFAPILLIGGMGIIAGWVLEKIATPMVNWFNKKLRVYDTDPD